jgi:hypothetical protein
MAKRERKPLNDKLAESFVFGQQSEGNVEIESSQLNPKKTKNLIEKLEAPAREPTIRFTVDLAESVHKKLSILAAKSGRKKAEIVRMLLDQALEDVES